MSRWNSPCKAVAIDQAGNSSAVACASYTYDPCLASCQDSCQASCQSLCQIMVQCPSYEIVPDFDSQFSSPGFDVLSAWQPTLMPDAPIGGAPAGSKKIENTDFTYDTSGNTMSEVKTTYNPDTQVVTGTQNKQYQRTKGNQLKKSTVDSQETRYRYNATGQRIEKINHDNAPTRYLYEGKHIMLELDINGNQTAKNIRGLSLAKRAVTGKQLYYFNNAHGDVTTLLSANGAISGKYYYDAFGNLEEEVDGQGNPYKYAGYEHDSETGLYYLRARYYSPKSARFISEDSYRGDRTDPLSLNLYTYCHNDPIRYIDPSGHVYLYEGMDEGSYYNRTGYENLQQELQQAKTLEEKAETARKLEYYQAAISAGDQVISNKAVRERIEYLEERAFGPSKSSATGTAKSTNEVKPNNEKLLDTFQTALDFAGILPVIGTAADTINGIIYLARGNYAQGIASLISTVPGLGDLIGGAMKTFMRAGGDTVIASCMKEILSYGDDLARYGKQLNLKGLKDTIKKIEGGIKEAVAQLDKLAKEVAGAGKGVGEAASANIHPGQLAAESSEVNQASIMRALRQSGTDEGQAVAKLLKRGNVKLSIEETHPKGWGGQYKFGDDTVSIYTDVASNPQRAAGYTAHEVKHYLQGIDSSTYRRIHEFEAFTLQRTVDKSFGLRDSSEIWNFINTNDAYKYVRK